MDKITLKPSYVKGNIIVPSSNSSFSNGPCPVTLLLRIISTLLFGIVKLWVNVIASISTPLASHPPNTSPSPIVADNSTVSPDVFSVSIIVSSSNVIFNVGL